MRMTLIRVNHSRNIFYLLFLFAFLFFACGKNEVVNVETNIPKGVTYTKATIGGTFSVDKSTEIIAAGICWSFNSFPTIDDTKIDTIRKNGVFYIHLTDLEPGKTYYTRAFVTTPNTTYYGSNCEFKTKTLPNNAIVDIEENIYHTITIGSQTWIVENLKTSHYRNGDIISFASNENAWINSTMGAYCIANNPMIPGTNRVHLYNQAAITDLRNIAPEGWRVSTDSDWQTLINHLGNDTLCGGKLKSMSAAYWPQPNIGANNQSGFSAYPSGYRDCLGIYKNLGLHTNFWTSTASDNDSTFAYNLKYNSSEIQKSTFSNKSGLAVRCIKE